MSNALHDYAKLFEKYAANNGGTGAILAGEDCLALANEMRMDADDLERENAKLRDELEVVGTAAYLYGRTDLEAENAKLRELVRDIYEVADPYLWEFIGRRKKALGIEVD